MAKERFILLSFDVEEFDMPLEYNHHIDLAEQLKVGDAGMQKILPVINTGKTPCTLFTTATYAIHFPEQIKAWQLIMKSHRILIIIQILVMNICCNLN